MIVLVINGIVHTHKGRTEPMDLSYIIYMFIYNEKKKALSD